MSIMNQEATAALMSEVLPCVAQELVLSPQLIRRIATSIDQALSQKLEERMMSAGDMADNASKQLEERISKTTEVANDAHNRLDTSGTQIANRLDEIQQALENMNEKIETTRAGCSPTMPRGRWQATHRSQEQPPKERQTHQDEVDVRRSAPKMLAGSTSGIG